MPKITFTPTPREPLTLTHEQEHELLDILVAAKVLMSAAAQGLKGNPIYCTPEIRADVERWLRTIATEDWS